MQKKKTHNNHHIQKILNGIQLAVDTFDCDHTEVTKKMIEDAGTHISDHAYKAVGGLELVKNAHFTDLNKDSIAIVDLKEKKKYKDTVELKKAKKEHFQDVLLSTIEKKLKALPKIKIPKKKPLKKGEIERHLLLMLNDTHYGSITKADEVGDVNSFDWTEASRRTAFMIKQMLTYKTHARNQVTKAHLILNGDLIAGVIHGLTTRTADLSIHQVNGAVHILTHAIHHLATEFPEVEVTGLSGNHEDLPHKREGGRAVTEKYDSFANMIFYSLSVAFRNNKHVKFNFPKTPYAILELPAGRAMVTHGDTIFSKSLGNPGKQVNVEGLSTQIKKFNAGEIAKGKDPIKLILFGHVHCYAHFITDDGVEGLIAPSLSGTDAYAHQLNINTNLAGQVIFESTKNFILGDHRLVRVTQADKDGSLDDLIPVFEKELAMPKEK